MKKQIDLTHGAHILGDTEAARKILTMFVEKLPGYIEEIQKQRGEDAWIQLHESIHSLKGASCYSSTPLLNQTVSELNQIINQVDEQTLSKEAIAQVDKLLELLVIQSKEVIKQATTINNGAS